MLFRFKRLLRKEFKKITMVETREYIFTAGGTILKKRKYSSGIETLTFNKVKKITVMWLDEICNAVHSMVKFLEMLERIVLNKSTIRSVRREYEEKYRMLCVALKLVRCALNV